VCAARSRSGEFRNADRDEGHSESRVQARELADLLCGSGMPAAKLAG
jgi:hypothetical protein